MLARVCTVFRNERGRLSRNEHGRLRRHICLLAHTERPGTCIPSVCYPASHWPRGVARTSLRCARASPRLPTPHAKRNKEIDDRCLHRCMQVRSQVRTSAAHSPKSSLCPGTGGRQRCGWHEGPCANLRTEVELGRCDSRACNSKCHPQPPGPSHTSSSPETPPPKSRPVATLTSRAQHARIRAQASLLHINMANSSSSGSSSNTLCHSITATQLHSFAPAQSQPMSSNLISCNQKQPPETSSHKQTLLPPMDKHAGLRAQVPSHLLHHHHQHHRQNHTHPHQQRQQQQQHDDSVPQRHSFRPAQSQPMSSCCARGVRCGCERRRAPATVLAPAGRCTGQRPRLERPW